ncbi:hypothetical protein ACHAXA_006268 [Cyclostephanos tholiformis]|jgi:hypothetical protein|uniref:F-box domain-containing protein n=1 Tax=Cyclostephanos tholiformis TaxID=382380 RepID=A0ABD3SPE5_9STRA
MKAPSPPEASALPNELWIRAFSYLDQRDLFALGNVSRNLLSASSADSLWEVACRRRWRGKHNVARFARKAKDGRTGGGVRDEENDRGTGRCSGALRRLLLDDPTRMPPLNVDGSVMHDPRSWKESYILAEIDSRRRFMSREELVSFRWQLIYDGSPSKMGLRKFNEDGTYWSPYMGLCTWILHGQRLIFAGLSLSVERDENTWGWIIGRGQKTTYYSVEGG